MSHIAQSIKYYIITIYSICLRSDIVIPPDNKAPKSTAEKKMQEGKRISENIFLCEDGKYRWIYEMSLFKNPTVIILVWKIFFFILLGIFAFVMLMDVFSGYMNGERFLETLKILGYFIIGMTVLEGEITKRYNNTPIIDSSRIISIITHCIESGDFFVL